MIKEPQYSKKMLKADNDVYYKSLLQYFYSDIAVFVENVRGIEEGSLAS